MHRVNSIQSIPIPDPIHCNSFFLIPIQFFQFNPFLILFHHNHSIRVQILAPTPLQCLCCHCCDKADFLLAFTQHIDYYIYNALEIIYNDFIKAKTINIIITLGDELCSQGQQSTIITPRPNLFYIYSY